MIDVATKTVIATVPVGEDPSGVNVTPDGSQVYVVNQGSDNVMIIDVATNMVVDTIEVGGEPVAEDLNISLALIRQESISYQVHNLLGQNLTQGQVRIGQEQLSLDVRDLKSGLYFLSIQGTGWIQTQSFVKN